MLLLVSARCFSFATIVPSLPFGREYSNRAVALSTPSASRRRTLRHGSVSGVPGQRGFHLRQQHAQVKGLGEHLAVVLLKECFVLLERVDGRRAHDHRDWPRGRIKRQEVQDHPA